MNFTPVKIPLVIQKVFPKYTWEIPSTTKEIYLTFDDGPTPKITHWVLDVLKTHNAKATFFCIGNNIEKHPDIFKQIIKEGHAIGNHTHNHLKGWKNTSTDYVENVTLAQNVIDSLHQNNSTKLFRPPYGQISIKQGAEILKLGYKIVMWTVLSIDWDKSISKETCLHNVLNKAKSGSIIVFHDSIKASKNMQYALPKVLEYFSEKGYTFKSL